MMFYIAILALLLQNTIKASAPDPLDAAAQAGFQSESESPFSRFTQSPFTDGPAPTKKEKSEQERAQLPPHPRPPNPHLAMLIRQMKDYASTQRAMLEQQKKDHEAIAKQILRLEMRINRLTQLSLLMQNHCIKRMNAQQKENQQMSAQIKDLAARIQALEKQREDEIDLLPSPLLSPLALPRRMSESKRPENRYAQYLEACAPPLQRSKTPPAKPHNQSAAQALGHKKGNKSVGYHSPLRIGTQNG